MQRLPPLLPIGEFAPGPAPMGRALLIGDAGSPDEPDLTVQRESHVGLGVSADRIYDDQGYPAARQRAGVQLSCSFKTAAQPTNPITRCYSYGPVIRFRAQTTTVV